MIQAMKKSVFPRANVIRRPNFSESRICPKIYRMFRSVDWTVTLIHLTRAQTLRIEKCATGPHKRANDYQRYSMLTALPLRSMSWTLGNSYSLQAAGDDHSCRYYNPLSAKKDNLKNFLCIWWKKTCLNQKIIKISNLIQAMKNSVCPKAKVIRRPNFPESRICPNINRMFRSYRSFRSVDWTHDMIILKRHLFIWHERKLCALTNAPPVQSTQTGQWLSTLFHASCSAAQVYVLYPRQFIFAPSCRRRPFL